MMDNKKLTNIFKKASLCRNFEKITYSKVAKETVIEYTYGKFKK